MPAPANLARAELQEIRWTKGGNVREVTETTPVKVQFNPETLKVAFANQSAGGNQRGRSAIQFIGTSTTKLSMQLWFDSTLPLPDGSMAPQGDVRQLTKKIAYFMEPKEKVGRKKWRPAGVRFLWGNFKFEGVMDSLEETLEYFSEDGTPLRASVSINISSQNIQFKFVRELSGNDTNVGKRQITTSRDRDTAQRIASETGDPRGALSMSRANGIERPHNIPAGTQLDPHLRV